MSDSWYARYPGDYGRDTRHLSLIEHGAYNILLDHYYATGRPFRPDIDELQRVCAAMTEAERAAVNKVVAEFFPANGDGLLHNKRADSEIQRRTYQHEALSAAGKRGVDKREAKRQAKSQGENKPGIMPGLCKTTSTPTSTENNQKPQPQAEVASPVKPAKPARAASKPDDAWMETIRAEYRKLGVDVDREAIKARAWLTGPKGKGRLFTRQFLLNWLNKADRSVEAGTGKTVEAPARKQTVNELRLQIEAAKAERDRLPTYNPTPEQKARHEELAARIRKWQKMMAGDEMT